MLKLVIAQISQNSVDQNKLEISIEKYLFRTLEHFKLTIR